MAMLVAIVLIIIVLGAAIAILVTNNEFLRAMTVTAANLLVLKLP
jgi:hypothetical protein